MHHRDPFTGKTFGAIRKAAEQGNEDVCRVLLEEGADIHEGYTPLHCAAGHGHIGVAQMLLDAGANPNAVEDRFGGMTPLHCAAGNGETEVGLMLLKHGADPEARTKNGDTCIVYAYRASDEVLEEAFKAHFAEKRAAKLEAAWGSTQPTKDNLQAAQPTQAAPAITTGRRPRF